MEIFSQLGKGTVVELWLPCARRQDVRAVDEITPKPSAENTSRGSRILLVDDDLLVSMNTAYMLMEMPRPRSREWRDRLAELLKIW